VVQEFDRPRMMNKFIPILAIGFTIFATVARAQDAADPPANKCGNLKDIIENVITVIGQVPNVADDTVKSALKTLKDALTEILKTLSNSGGEQQVDIAAAVTKLMDDVKLAIIATVRNLASLLNSKALYEFLIELTKSLTPLLTYVKCIVANGLDDGGLITAVFTLVQKLLASILGN